MALKPAPKLEVSVDRMPHPAFFGCSGALVSQTVVLAVPDMPIFWMEQPLEVWRVIVFVVAPLTPSMMSISPIAGQLGPTSQKAGQTPQIPPGICAISAKNRPLL